MFSMKAGIRISRIAGADGNQKLHDYPVQELVTLPAKLDARSTSSSWDPAGWVDIRLVGALGLEVAADTEHRTYARRRRHPLLSNRKRDRQVAGRLSPVSRPRLAGELEL